MTINFFLSKDGCANATHTRVSPRINKVSLTEKLIVCDRKLINRPLEAKETFLIAIRISNFSFECERNKFDAANQSSVFRSAVLMNQAKLLDEWIADPKYRWSMTGGIDDPLFKLVFTSIESERYPITDPEHIQLDYSEYSIDMTVPCASPNEQHSINKIKLYYRDEEALLFHMVYLYRSIKGLFDHADNLRSVHEFKWDCSQDEVFWASLDYIHVSVSIVFTRILDVGRKRWKRCTKDSKFKLDRKINSWRILSFSSLDYGTLDNKGDHGWLESFVGNDLRRNLR